MNFNQKIVFITGAASGIGKATAEAFAAQGAHLFLTDRNATDGIALAQTLDAQGAKAHFQTCDVTDGAEVEAAIAACVMMFGGLDLCINSAGIAGTSMTTPTHLFSEATFEQIMDINAKGVFLCMKYQLPHLVARKNGVIINLASVAGLAAVPGNIGYCASKWAVVGMTKTAAVEYVRYGVRVHAVCPVFTDTPMVHHSIMTGEDGGERLIKAIPMRRLAEVREVVAAILFLCSDGASFMTGHALPVDGGMLAR